MGKGWIYQVDNDPKYIACVVEIFLCEGNVNKTNWPTQSPDPNPIEMLQIDMEK